MANFAFNNSPAFSDNAARRSAVPAIPTPAELDERYAMPEATPDQMERMSYEDVLAKTLGGFAVLVAGAAVGWFLPFLALPAAIAGLVLALVNTFKKKPSPALVLSYAAVEGVFVGGISAIFASVPGWGGIVPMAVLGTLGVVGVTLALFASGKVRASARATKIFLIAIIGYAAFSLVNLGLMLFGVTESTFGVRDVTIPIPILGDVPLGVILGILVVFLAAYSLVLGFDMVKRGVETGQPRIYGWTAAFGIMVTVVWLYVEILRLLSYFLPRN